MQQKKSYGSLWVKGGNLIPANARFLEQRHFIVDIPRLHQQTSLRMQRKTAGKAHRQLLPTILVSPLSSLCHLRAPRLRGVGMMKRNPQGCGTWMTVLMRRSIEGATESYSDDPGLGFWV